MKKYCLDCKKLLGDYRSIRCPECNKIFRHENKKIFFCKDCGKELSRPDAKRCINCYIIWLKENYKNFNFPSNKGINNGFFSKHHTDEVKKILSELNKGENHPNWQGGISFEPYSPLWTEELKIKIRQRDNCECQNCNMTQEEHFIVAGCDLNVHHIDYDKKNCNEDNLIAVCLWCNCRANSNRNYWQDFYNNKIKLIKIKGK